MDRVEINKYLDLLDGRGSDEEHEAVAVLSTLGMKFQELLLNKYRAFKKWGERASCVYHACKFAVSSPYSFELGINALNDRSKIVRYRACMLLAVAQNEKAIGPLEALLSIPESAADAMTAIEAIRNKNQNLFVDRNHTGNVVLNIVQVHS